MSGVTIPFKVGLRSIVQEKGDAFLSVSLLIVAVILVVVALSNLHPFIKAGVLVWVVLP